MKTVTLQIWTPRPRPGLVIVHAKEQQDKKDFGNAPPINGGGDPCSAFADCSGVCNPELCPTEQAPGAEWPTVGTVVGPTDMVSSGPDYVTPTPASSIRRVYYDAIEATENVHYTTSGVVVTPMSGLLAGTEVTATYVAE